ncbi:MAG: acyl-CoA desaturase [Phycisphaerae bacterium]|mgnify:CR=1 FL=1|nr:acyl-CoA desaturase [Phycisphaerae bacterium]MAT80709.1 acyl-CoA desaturase [Phycisphaerae bacterium]
MTSAIPTQPTLQAPRGARITVLISVVLPPLALITVMWLAWGTGFGILDLSLFAGMYLICGLGITIGFHRYFSHKSFECPRWVKWMLGITGSMACQGDLYWWCAVHRTHHQHSDEADDPHSPHVGSGGRLRRFIYSHFGWLFRIEQPDQQRYVPDLKADRDLQIISKLFPFWVFLSLLIPTVLGGVLSGSWFGALTGFLWGGLVRIFFEHHVTWSVNSVCHIWGAQPYDSHDHSRNNAIVGVLALGEGWHNNHHAFPTSARHGLAWWQFDSSWIIIKMMSMVGMARALKTPSPERMAKSTNKAVIDESGH